MIWFISFEIEIQLVNTATGNEKEPISTFTLESTKKY